MACFPIHWLRGLENEEYGGQETKTRGKFKGWTEQALVREGERGFQHRRLRFLGNQTQRNPKM